MSTCPTPFILLTLTLFLAGCSVPRFTPSMVSGNTLENDSVGFGGISLKFPDGYEAQTLVSEGEKPNSFGQRAWVNTKHMDEKFGTQLEHVAFGTKTRGIAFCIVQMPVQIGPKFEDEFIQQSIMTTAARKFIFKQGKDVKRSVRKIGTGYVSCVSCVSLTGKTYNSVRQLISRPSYFLVLSGQCVAGEEALLDADLDSVAASIQPTKQ